LDFIFNKDSHEKNNEKIHENSNEKYVKIPTKNTLKFQQKTYENSNKKCVNMLQFHINSC